MPKTLLMSYTQTGRQLQRLIIAILKQGLAYNIHRINYAKSYRLVAGKIQRQEEKIVIIKTSSQKEEKLLAFLKKQQVNHLILSSAQDNSDIDQDYAARLATG